MSTCEFCSSILSTKGAVKSHQRRAKYCIEIQRSRNILVAPVNEICSFCSKNFTRRDDKFKHEIICKSNLDNNPELKKKIEDSKAELKACELKWKLKIEDIEIDYEIKLKDIERDWKVKLRISEKKLKEKDSEIKKLNLKIEKLESETNDLKVKVEATRGDIYEKLHSKVEDCIEKIATQPTINTITNSTNKTNNTNNILNNMPCFNTTLEQLTQAATDKFDMNLFMQGQLGAATFFLDHLREANDGKVPLVVTDKSRDILKFKDKDKNIIVDPKAKKLTQMVYDALKARNQEHYDSVYNKKSKKKSKKAHVKVIRNEDSDYERNYSDDEKRDSEKDERSDDSDNSDEGNNSDDQREHQADLSYVAIKRLTKDNKLFRQKLIESM